VTPDAETVVAGIPIPSTSPIFLTVVGLHVLGGLVCVVAGAIAMLSPKRSGRLPTFGTIYYWSLVGAPPGGGADGQRAARSEWH
jgi:hypothetical protein